MTKASSDEICHVSVSSAEKVIKDKYNEIRYPVMRSQSRRMRRGERMRMEKEKGEKERKKGENKSEWENEVTDAEENWMNGQPLGGDDEYDFQIDLSRW